MEENALKKLLKNTVYIGLLGLFLISTGCDSDEDMLGTGDPDAVSGAKITLSIQGTRPGANLGKSFIWSSAFVDTVVLSVEDVSGVEIGILSLTDARVALKEIKIKLAEEEVDSTNEEEDDNVKFKGPYVVDLITNTISPSLDTITVIPGNYKEIELKLHKIKGEEKDDDSITVLIGPDDPLFGNSIYIAGTYTGATADSVVTDVPFFLSFDFDEKFRLTGIDSSTGIADTSLGFEVVDEAVSSVIIAFRQAKWFIFDDPETNKKMLDFNSITLSQDSTGAAIILLDEDTEDDNEDIRRVIKENIKESADYGRDKDGNGELESDEDDDPDDDDGDDG